VEKASRLGLLYWGPWKICYTRLWKWASVSVDPRFLGTWMGVLFLGPLREVKIFLLRGIFVRVSRDIKKCPINGYLFP
jgi:hypothetical protein